MSPISSTERYTLPTMEAMRGVGWEWHRKWTDLALKVRQLGGQDGQADVGRGDEKDEEDGLRRATQHSAEVMQSNGAATVEGVHGEVDGSQGRRPERQPNVTEQEACQRFVFALVFQLQCHGRGKSVIPNLRKCCI